MEFLLGDVEDYAVFSISINSLLWVSQPAAKLAPYVLILGEGRDTLKASKATKVVEEVSSQASF